MTLIANCGIRKGCGTRFHCPKPKGTGAAEHLAPNVAGAAGVFNPPRISDRTLAQAWSLAVHGDRPAKMLLLADEYLSWEADHAAI